jgi:predicted transcriptional regulator of viral defense system
MIARSQHSSFTIKDAAETFGVTDRQARRILAEWEHIGAAVESERGRYMLEGCIIQAAAHIQNAARA